MFVLHLLILYVTSHPSKHKTQDKTPNAVPMLGRRRRRWANIEMALGECLVFAGSEQGFYEHVLLSCG